MSGTSLDGVDGVLARFDGEGAIQVEGHAFLGFDAALRDTLFALNQSGADELHRAAIAANALSRCYAAVVHQLLDDAGGSATVRKVQGRAAARSAALRGRNEASASRRPTRARCRAAASRAPALRA